mmetsp:Transcript_54315/g.157011  ORF Transcript_54315/g.157011 Transcript_54315/m.157011 type:complete len:533 (+) Transcript_54315:1424-3022(+)
MQRMILLVGHRLQDAHDLCEHLLWQLEPVHGLRESDDFVAAQRPVLVLVVLLKRAFPFLLLVNGRPLPVRPVLGRLRLFSQAIQRPVPGVQLRDDILELHGLATVRIVVAEVLRLILHPLLRLLDLELATINNLLHAIGGLHHRLRRRALHVSQGLRGALRLLDLRLRFFQVLGGIRHQALDPRGLLLSPPLLLYAPPLLFRAPGVLLVNSSLRLLERQLGLVRNRTRLGAQEVSLLLQHILQIRLIRVEGLGGRALHSLDNPSNRRHGHLLPPFGLLFAPPPFSLLPPALLLLALSASPRLLLALSRLLLGATPSLLQALLLVAPPAFLLAPTLIFLLAPAAIVLAPPVVLPRSSGVNIVAPWIPDAAARVASSVATRSASGVASEVLVAPPPVVVLGRPGAPRRRGRRRQPSGVGAAASVAVASRSRGHAEGVVHQAVPRHAPTRGRRENRGLVVVVGPDLVAANLWSEPPAAEARAVAVVPEIDEHADGVAARVSDDLLVHRSTVVALARREMPCNQGRHRAIVATTHD